MMARAAPDGSRSVRDGTSRLAPLAPPTLGATALEALRTSILRGRFAPGERLVEAPLSRVLQISRGPLREALALLEREGLVENLPRRGKFVVELTEKTVDEHYSLRRVLEEYAVGQLIASMNPRKRRILEAGIKRMQDAALTRDSLRLSLSDLAFHESLYQLADNDLLLRIWHESVAGKLRLLINITGKTHSSLNTVANHEHLVLAIVEGDVEGAQAQIRGHVDDAWRRAQESLAASRTPL